MDEYEILVYCDLRGKEPFTKWLHGLKDRRGRKTVLLRIQRVRSGIFGDCKSIKGYRGLYELRIDYGPGYRIYFGKVGDQIILLLIGGKKGTQSRDIDLAAKYFFEYRGNV